ncbi:prenyltransferase/squalene oxidase repeat-containing protein [Chloroflexus sp.]|uniref:prenyltransferase/squalene oxidase repeat-containing protein n=1 Tax=Chloroflexus sp. TaxID=1904827 RepID=UPI00298EDB43|nr:prenyltransferase/squalene oxidase repeat-containing protein [Chloroflexus sp.]MCS6886827.1 terpene cyclase/mutase family protein [Chloroflexus sp.]MDW8402850.1 terpene cyclase/mutase family protein [Chloroflexus sp.]
MRRVLALFLTIILSAIIWQPVAAQSAAVAAALQWVAGQQQADGSFAGFGPGDTADAVVAFVAGGQQPPASAVNYLAGQAASYGTSSAGATAKLILAAVAAGRDPLNFGGVNLARQLGSTYSATTGQYGSDVYGHALALLAIKAMGAQPPAAAIDRLISLQLRDGGWSFDGAAATGSDTNTTALAVMALAGRARAADALNAARAYLRGQQNPDGGFPYSQTSAFGNASDANSTAAVAMAIIALGEDPSGAAWKQGDATPLSALAAFQNSSGAFRYQNAMPDDNALATYQAIPALAGRALPVVTTSIPAAQSLIAPATALPRTAGEAQPVAPLLALAGLLLIVVGKALQRRA